jgi:hypothetical protein
MYGDNGFDSEKFDIGVDSKAHADLGLRYYDSKIINIVKEISKLNYKNEFKNWFLGKEEPKKDYPNLTGLEPIGTVGYMDDILSTVRYCDGKIWCSYCVKYSENIGCKFGNCCKQNRSDKKYVYYQKVTKY